MLETVKQTRERSGWTVNQILGSLRLSRSVYYDWRGRSCRLEDASPPGFLLDRPLPEEVERVVAYALEHPREGYRRLAWMMVDEDVADVIHAALEKHPEVHPQIVHDRWSQFTGKEFRRLVKRFDLEDIPTRVAHPQSNGVQERWFRSLRQEGLTDRDLPVTTRRWRSSARGWRTTTKSACTLR